jgi:hypothetical protein
MKVTRVLSTAMLFLLPSVIVSAYAQEHEQEKQPAQKQQQAKPAQHQQQAKPAKQTQQAQHPREAKPATQPQHAASQPKAKPAQQAQRGQQQQRASRGAQTAASHGGHGSIPEAKFRASFGSAHTFHVNRSQFANGSGRFQYGGFWFNALNPWPAGWLYTDSVYVDYLNGGYFLCDPVHPGVYISISIG